MAKPDPYIVGIDVGSSKVGVLIAQRAESGEIEVIGRGQAPNRGTRRGHIVNVEATVEAIKSACEEAEVMAGVEISQAWVGFSGADVRSINSEGMVTVSRKDREITIQDIQRVLDAARTEALPSDREILHAIPQEFVVDEQGGIADPLGMLGSRLEARVHLVTGQTARAKTLLTSLNRAGIEVVEVVFEMLANGEAVLAHDEKELGTLLIDVGCGTTNYAVYAEGEVRHSAVLPIGAGHFTSDLATVLRTPFAEAERIKIQRGCCLVSMVGADEGVSIPTVAGGATRVVPKREISEILQPRGEELFQVILRDLNRVGLKDAIRGGVVLTGGGAQLDGLLELAEQIFAASVRYGLPRGLSGLVDVINCPTWCTASGLLVWGASTDRRMRRSGRRPTMSMRGWMGTIKNMFSDLL